MSPEKWLLELQQIAAEQGNTIMRMRFALLMLRQYSTTKDFDGLVRHIVCRWIDGGMKGSVPWPDSAFFAQWAAEKGWTNINGNVGFGFAACTDRKSVV